MFIEVLDSAFLHSINGTDHYSVLCIRYLAGFQAMKVSNRLTCRISSLCIRMGQSRENSTWERKEEVSYLSRSLPGLKERENEDGKSKSLSLRLSETPWTVARQAPLSWKGREGNSKQRQQKYKSRGCHVEKGHQGTAEKATLNAFWDQGDNTSEWSPQGCSQPWEDCPGWRAAERWTRGLRGIKQDPRSPPLLTKKWALAIYMVIQTETTFPQPSLQPDVATPRTC